MAECQDVSELFHHPSMVPIDMATMNAESMSAGAARRICSPRTRHLELLQNAYLREFIDQTAVEIVSVIVHPTMPCTH